MSSSIASFAIKWGKMQFVWQKYLLKYSSVTLEISRINSSYSDLCLHSCFFCSFMTYFVMFCRVRFPWCHVNAGPNKQPASESAEHLGLTLENSAAETFFCAALIMSLWACEKNKFNSF